VQVRTVTGPDEAAAELAGEPCHCVVLDLDMAGGAALLILDALDGDPAMRQVPVLAHHTRPLDPGQELLLRERARAKPLELLPSLDELRERIALRLTADRPADVLPLSQTPAAPETQPGPLGPKGQRAGRQRSALAGRTALVVDDDARNVYALTGMLELQGMRVLHADNGRKGIETLFRHRDIDLILMDVMMPEMDGYAATAAIRAMPEYVGLPIIAVTAKAMEGDREKTLAAGANDYITKPVDIDALVACMQRWLGL
jgi:CheY-like chemotaxis protein